MRVLVNGIQAAAIGQVITKLDALELLALDGLTENEISLVFSDFNEVRSHRQSLLTESDNLVDTALDKGIDATLFRQYRQALRDIPQTFTDAQDVVWPQKPLLPPVSA